VFAPAPLPRNLEASFRDLGSEKAATRASAIRDVVRHALGGVGSGDQVRARGIGAIEKVLRDDEVAAVRAGAATALADLGASEALPTLLMAVEDDDAHVRQMALSALGEIGDVRAAQRLERALRDDRPEVRYQAVIAYARVHKDDIAAVAQALLRALDDRDEAIRYIAMRVAEEQLGARGGVASDERLATRARELASGTDEAVAVVAGLYLARMGEARGRAIVLDVVAERLQPPELEDEQACVELSGELELRDAIPHLERRAWGRRRVLRAVFSWGAGDASSCAWHARIALARLGHERARAQILAELGSWRRETREAAVVAVGRARLHEARSVLQDMQETQDGQQTQNGKLNGKQNAKLNGKGGSVDAALVREALVRLAVD
jgi:HEAT repeat protein